MIVPARHVGAVPPNDARLHGLDERFARTRRRLDRGGRLRRYAEALWRFLRNPAESWSRRALAAGALLYLVTPFDAWPDWLPGGFADDLVVVLAVAARLRTYLAPYLEADVR